MKKFIYIILFSIFLFGCATTNVQPKINKDNRALKKDMMKYPGYKELVKRGFDINSLNYITNIDEFREALEPYWYNEKGQPLDNHFDHGKDYRWGPHFQKVFLTDTIAVSFDKFSYIDENGKKCTSERERKFGTKEELLSQGYIENETMFYYPANGEKDWVVGWKDRNIMPYYAFGKLTRFHSESYTFIKHQNYILLKIFHHPDSETQYNDFYEKAKDYNTIIVDLASDTGGIDCDGYNILNKLLSLKDKNIFVIISSTTASCGEILAWNLREKNPNIKLIGSNTSGTVKYCVPFENKRYYPSLEFDITYPAELNDYYNFSMIREDIEGIGIYPDYWATSAEDVIKTINWALGEEIINDNIYKGL